MRTPIVDFVKAYADADVSRFHMPGHKGRAMLGCEPYDITEIKGADVLSDADGVIAESEAYASALFGARSFYSTEGSTLCIKTMLALVASESKRQTRPLILAARNVHKAFVYACALLDLRVEWLDPATPAHLCACPITARDVEKALDAMQEKPAAVYLTSPDYLGNLADVEGIAKVCRARSIPLLIDNAHGAYLRFLEPSQHPISLGATMCCDSAHKTLPVLTGGAYLHLSPDAPFDAQTVRRRMALFASTSPSYLILQSLDLCNRYKPTNARDSSRKDSGCNRSIFATAIFPRTIPRVCRLVSNGLKKSNGCLSRADFHPSRPNHSSWCFTHRGLDIRVRNWRSICANTRWKPSLPTANIWC